MNEAITIIPGAKWQQSKTGMWHKVGTRYLVSGDPNLPKCQSYNLDRPNELRGPEVDTPPEGARICRKCANHN